MEHSSIRKNYTSQNVILMKLRKFVLQKILPNSYWSPQVGAERSFFYTLSSLFLHSPILMSLLPLMLKVATILSFSKNCSTLVLKFAEGRDAVANVHWHLVWGARHLISIILVLVLKTSLLIAETAGTCVINTRTFWILGSHHCYFSHF